MKYKFKVGPAGAMENGEMSKSEFLSCWFLLQMCDICFKVFVFKATKDNQINYEWIVPQQNPQNAKWPPIFILGFSLFSVVDTFVEISL